MITKGLGTYGNAVGTVTPLDHKMAQLGVVLKTAANTIRPGLFWDGNSTVVSGKANMSYDVRAFSAVLSRGATAGAVLLTNDGTYNVVTTAAPGSNSRYDVVYLWQREYSLDGTDSNPVIGVVQGTAAASPTVPSLSSFPGAIELARILVPAGVTATNSGTTITQTAPFTSTDGSPVVFRNTTEMNAWTAALPEQTARDLSTNVNYRWDGSNWRRTLPYLEMTCAATIDNNQARTLGTVSTPIAAAWTEVSDVSGWHDASTNPTRITPNVSGRYLALVEVAWNGNTSGLRYGHLGLNGTFPARWRRLLPSTASDATGGVGIAVEVTLNGTSDYLEVNVLQSSGGNLAVDARVVVRYLGPA